MKSIKLSLIYLLHLFRSCISNELQQLDCPKTNRFESFIKKFLPLAKIVSKDENYIFPKDNLNTTEPVEEIIFPEFITDFNFERSILSPYYNKTKYEIIRKKLLSKSIITIITIGGSITCGHIIQNVNAKGDRTIAEISSWPYYLESFLNSTYKHPTIHVYNFARPSTGTEVHIDFVTRWRNEPNNKILNADMIFVETSVNDGFIGSEHFDRYNSKGRDIDAQETEILVRQLLALPNSPAVVYVGVSTGDADPIAVYPVFSHQKVNMLYGNAQIEMIKLFNPRESKMKKKWLETVYKGRLDPVHLTSFGHKLVAISLLTLLEMVMCNRIESQYYRNVQSRSFVTVQDDPVFVSKKFSKMYEQGVPYFICSREINQWKKPLNNLPKNYNFQLKKENHKEALSANKTGSIHIIQLPPHILLTHLKYGIIIVEYLISYNRMGLMKISVYDSDLITNKININNNTSLRCRDYFSTVALEELSIDTLHREKVSIAKTMQLKINNNSSFHNRPFHLCIEIVKTKPIRLENKISIFSLTVY